MKIIEINNRRFLGNKFKLLPFIKNIVDEHCENVHSVADLFAGTGSVAYAFAPNYKVITNDILYSNYISHVAWFSSENYDKKKLIDYIEYFNNTTNHHTNYMSKHFANTYFSKEECYKIGFVRERIEKDTKAGYLNQRERALMITSLIYAMDRIAHTCGHYDAFIQDGNYEGKIELGLPKTIDNLNPDNEIYNMDINVLAPQIDADVVYLDPPYNSRQYCDSYHLLENVARWKKPKVEGVARKMDRSPLKSKYCKRSEAAQAFEDLIQNLNTRYILLSYNNMSKKGDDRSNARISDDDIMRILEAKGDVQVFAEDYKAFTTGLSDIQDNQERIFLCTVR